MTLRDRFEGLRSAWWLGSCEFVGERPSLHGRPCIDVYGGAIRIGSRCAIASRPVMSHFVAGPGALLNIGDEVRFGHGAAVAAFDRIEIGAGTRFGPFVIIMDTNFHDRSGDQSVHHDCRPVKIGVHCRIGSRVTITRGVTIGDGAEILAGSVVTGSIPAGVCAGGSRARVLGRAGDPNTRWHSPAAMAPVAFADTFDLTAIPDPDIVLADTLDWNPHGIDRYRSALDSSSMRISTAELAGCRTLTDVIAAIEATDSHPAPQDDTNGT